MVNIELLKAAMKDKGITIDEASEVIGINPATFYRRIGRNGENFTVAEVGKLAEMLEMPNETMQKIFFDKELA